MHIEPKSIELYPWYLRWFFRTQEKKLGQILLPGLFWGRFPFLQILFVFFWSYLERKTSTLDPALRALVQVRVAQLNGCSFCIDYNSLNLLKRTNTIEKANNLIEWQMSPIFSETERNVLEFVDIVSGPQVKVPQKTFNKLKSNFSDDQIIELTALISFQNMSAKFNAALDIPSQGLCKI